MIKIDFHVHSKLSNDGRESLEQIAGAAKAAGLDAVCICDHNDYALDKIVEIGGVALLPGCEISSADAHVLAMLCDVPVDVRALLQKGLPETEQLISEIHKCGGIAVIAHPFGHTQKSSWDGSGLKPDAVERYNARAWMKCADADRLAAEYAQSVNAACIAGSDAHFAGEIGNAYTLVDCNGISEIKDAVLAHRTESVLVRNTKRIYKGKSQLLRGKREGGLKRRFLSICVFAKCLMLDLLGK